MHPVNITLNFPSLSAALDALNLLNGSTIAGATIAHADRPDVGAIPIVPGPPVAEANPFAAAAATVTPIVPGVPVIPPAPGAASVPTGVPTVTVGVPPVGVELDKAGLPWDGRIHGSTKTKNKDGTWRSKRDLDDAVRVAVEAELRAGQAARVPASVAAAVTAAAVTPMPAAVVAPPPAAPAAIVAPPPAAPVAETFGTLMARLAPQMQVPGKLEIINTSLQAFGLVSLAGLAGRGDLVAPFAAYVDPQLAAVPA